nr:hypothetical protein [Tanacetum cinerariifolium]
MTRSYTKELFLPLENLEQKFRSKRRLFDTPILIESNSPEFDQISDIDEQSKEKVRETMTKTMEQYMSKTRGDYGSGVTRPTIKQDTQLQLKGQFLKELRDNTFSGSEHKDANEHIEKVLVKIDDPNITMEEYIRLEEEKARRHGKVYNWETATYDLENDNDKVNMPSFPSPELEVSYFDDLDSLKDFEKEFPAIVYNDALTSKSYFLTEPTVSPQHIDEFDLKDETSLSQCDEEEQNVLNFNDLFSFNVFYPNDSKSDKDNDDDKVNIEHSLRDLSIKSLPNLMNIDAGAYAHGSNKLLKTSHDTSYNFFKIETFIKGLNVNIVACNYLNKGMSFIFLIKNLMLYADALIVTGLIVSSTSPVSLTGAASKWQRNHPSSSITTWEVLKTKFLNKYCPPARTAKKMEEINNFQQEPDESIFHAWERFKELLMKCPQHYLTDMQEVILFYNRLDVPT